MDEIRDEFYTFDTENAISEARLCKHCKFRPCTKACPLNVNIAKILNLIVNYKLKDAYDLLMDRNVLAYYTSFYCKERPYCTLMCNSNYRDSFFGKIKTDPIDIPLIERFLMNYIRDNGDQILMNRERSKKQVAMIGSNAAIIACAFYLIYNGFNVTIFEKEGQIGSDLRTGLSNIKLANEIVDEYEKTLLDFGTVIQKNINLDNEFNINKIRKEYDYVVLSSKFDSQQTINIAGETRCFANPLNDVMHLIMYAKDFIKLSNREDYFKSDDEVIVIGNSLVSFDAARIANKFVDKINLVFVNDEKNSCISNDDIIKSKLKNIQIFYNQKPVRVNIVNGKIEVTFVRTKNVKDSKLGNYVEDIFDSEFTKVCNHLIIDKDTVNTINSQLSKLSGITFDRSSTVITDEKGVASSDGTIYACGELAGKDTNILSLIKDGTDIAKSIISESGGDIQEYKDEINDIIRRQNANIFNEKGMGDLNE